jgi:hypothetical protein
MKKLNVRFLFVALPIGLIVSFAAWYWFFKLIFWLHAKGVF